MARYYTERNRPPASDGLAPPSYPRQTGSRSRSREPPPIRDSSSAQRPDSRYDTSRHESSRRRPSNPPSTRPTVYPNTRVKRTWPPAPAVEDEKASLAREANGPKVADSEKCEARFRGAVDQTPIILEVEIPQSRPQTRGPQSEGQNHFQTDRSVDRSRPRRDPTLFDQRRKTDLEEGTFEIPEFRRTASPYAFMPKNPDHSSTVSKDSGYYSSDVKSESSSASLGKNRGADAYTEGSWSDALRGNGKTRNSFEGDGRSERRSAVGKDSAPAVDSRGDRRPAPYSSFSSGNSEKEGSSANRDISQMEQRPRLAKLKAEAVEANRRSSDPASTAPRPQFDDLAKMQPSAGLSRRRAPAPIGTQYSWQQPADAPSRGSSRQSSTSRPDSRPSSRPSSPTGLPSMRSHSPPRSPYVTTTPYRNETSWSARSSVSASASGSRPASPGQIFGTSNHAAPRPEEGIRRSSTFPVAMEEKPQRSSRLADSSHVDDVSSPSNASGMPSLPYPVDDLSIMPSEEHHRYNPQSLDEPFVPWQATSPSNLPTRDRALDSPTTSRPTSLEMPPMRPSLKSRHTFEGDLPTLVTAMPGLELASSTAKVPETPMTPRTSAGGSDKPRTRCLKVQSDKNFDGWYSLVGCPEFEMCPPCFNSHIAPSSFRKFFQQVQRKEANPSVICSFRTPWYAMAWQLTQEQQRFDLDLFYGLVKASKERPSCPGKHREIRAWHTVYDDRGEPVHEFDVCPGDVKKIEALMPTLRSVFQESHKSGRKRRCNLRLESTRCTEYLERLREIDATAQRKRKHPDTGSFVELARQKAMMRECARDDLMIDRTWHFAPQLPEFTVCEECYSTVVWPAIKDGSQVAKKISMTPDLVNDERKVGDGDSRSGAGIIIGTSCQLYSRRMRRVFRKAVELNDFEHLAVRAKDRKGAEMELQADCARLQQVAKDLDRAIASGSERRSQQAQMQREDLNEDFNKIIEHWRKWE